MNKAFTLIELMIVLFVISLVSAIAIPKYSNLTSEAKVANVQANLSNLNTAIEMYNLKNGSYPELEGNQTASLYQEIETTPGTTLTWSISHMERVGEDVSTVSFCYRDESIVLEIMTDGNTEWGTYTGTYVVPEGQTTTIFYVDAVSTATGSASVGNFIDAFSVTSQ
ncbi:prepilin-type N-terminal cleavage/methylation domain-containing protein [uncultured Ilyobacter sp.]|uniref:prepilin-type N-terminal cleavage/methylation domain-containing protein n=1 Tax=uncultured Ilyobacter sp. TaxID=544433 RepID=UPI0029C01E37|nr:prepilin-type N-terminal cleavage/methylation domain-containing protein [uncultured Ilyobacter sp.]